MRAPRNVDRALDTGLQRIREQFHVPAGFGPEAALGGDRSGPPARPAPITSTARTGRSSRSTRPARPTSTRRSRWRRPARDVVLHYAIADVGFFVRPGDALDVEAWTRGLTVYLPDERARLYPAALSEGAASLLPDGPRPAVVFTVRVGDGRRVDARRCRAGARAQPGEAGLRHGAAGGPPARVRRAVPPHRGGRGARAARHGSSSPSRSSIASTGGWVLRFDPRLPSEDANAGMSLATNLAVADAMLAAGTGLFRVMAEPSPTAPSPACAARPGRSG